MSRNLHATTLANLQADYLSLAYLLKFELDSAEYHFWTGRYDIVYNSDTYLGNGYIESISSIEDSKERNEVGLQVQLSGIPSAFISACLSNGNQASPCELYLATLSNFAISGDPVLVFKGIVDTIEIINDAINPLIQLIYTGKYDDLTRHTEHRYTASTQKEFVANDKGFDYVAQLQKWTGVWGHYKKKNTEKKRR